MARISSKPSGKSAKSPKKPKTKEDYFRLRDFEYVQPLYDLAFLLEVEALSKRSAVPKYRTFSLWRAGYSLDGYGTQIDRWLDNTIDDEDLDYVPSSRIREYLSETKKSGTIPELRSYRGERYARCLRLRSVRGLGPSQIALSIAASSRPEEWLKQFGKESPSHQVRISQLYHSRNPGPWQTAHLVPPILRFLRAIETDVKQDAKWNVDGIEDPFDPVVRPVNISGDIDWTMLQASIGRVLKRERLFRKEASSDGDKISICHQMGWTFCLKKDPQTSRSGAIPQLIQKLDPFGASHSSGIVSDLHLHTAWSDGSASVNKMASAIVASGLKYFAVTDHSRSCKLQGGLTPVLWLRQANALTLATPVCPVLHGIEVDILKDGTLDLPDSLLAATDLVVASVHSSWTDDRRENTNRLIRAIESGRIDILAHPTSAVVGKPGVPDYLREPAPVEWEEIFSICATWRVALEMNCFPSRLDLPLRLLRQAVKAGCAISLGSDAHARSHLQNLRFGEAALQRIEAKIVLNRLSYNELKLWVRKSREFRTKIAKTVFSHEQNELLFEPAIEKRESQFTASIEPPQKIPFGSRVIGIDLTAGDKATGIATLESSHVETCSLSTDEQILEFVRKHNPAIVSIDSPLGLPGGGATIDPMAGIVRVAEHDLASVGIPAYPALIDSMEKLTLRGIGLRAAIEALPNPPTVIESYPGAAQDILCIPRKQKSLSLLREGLRRLGLEGPGLETTSHDEMDAITSAIVGRYHEAGQFEPMGIPSEAQLIVPKVPPLSFNHPPIICLAGKTGAGKSVAARYLSVFYGFTWVRTRNLIRSLLLEDTSASPKKRLFPKKIDPKAITESDLREFGAIILDVYKQVPLRNHLMKTVLGINSPVVVDSIRDIVDIDRKALTTRPVVIWFIDCTDSIIHSRLIGTKKLGEKRPLTGSPVDRTAPEIRRESDHIISNSGSLEELRWRVDNTLFASLKLAI